MRSNQFIKKIRFYALISFLLPLIAINSCMFLYKSLGHIDVYQGFNWNEKEIEYTLNERALIESNSELWTLANCPKYKYRKFYITADNKAIEAPAPGQNYDNKAIDFTWLAANKTIEDQIKDANLIENLLASNKIKSVIFKQGKIKNSLCVKNYRFAYLLLNNFSTLDKILVSTIKKSPSGYSKIKNPYFYGEVSISRTARYFPATLIFKPLITLSAFLLFLYWKNNLNLFRELKNKNILVNFSKKFFYFGIFSCIFLMLHAIFLGLDFDSKLFSITRRLIIILFILFEIIAQILLTKNLFRFREKLKKYINPLILKIKIIFVVIVFFITCIAFIILAFGDPSVAFKHTLEWNYFAFLLVYYLLSRLLWKKNKTQVHTPEGA